MSPVIRAANAEQRQASDPEASVFVSASAGSGKTKLLVDRLLRLMLPHGEPEHPGSDPSRIQCLTFTKAAAAEMSIRLQARLGGWIGLSDAALDAALADLEVRPCAEHRLAARALFARVLDLPGGMRISTIHAFCQSLLRRFPLEASISPHFQLAEETGGKLALLQSAEDVLAARPPGDDVVAQLAGQVGMQEFTELVTKLQTALRAPERGLDRALDAGPEALAAALRRVAGVDHADELACLAASVRWPQEAGLARALRLVQQQGAPAAREAALVRLDWLALDAAARCSAWPQWRGLALDVDGGPRKPGGIVRGRLLQDHPWIADALAAEGERVAAVEDACRSLRSAVLTAALLQVAGPILAHHARGKQLSGLLDYDDLIARTLRLLADPGVAWVMYKLDGGLDHLLLDEVQDTSPLQWQVASSLTGEFFAGEGARRAPGAGPRTIFAVGDFKQSIYSFQGAAPDQFHVWRERFRGWVQGSGGLWREPALTVSFRSTEPVLQLVDAVFADDEARQGLLEPGGEWRAHQAARTGAPGRVELWPLVPPAEAPAPSGPWEAPVANTGQETALQRLAEALARWIAGEIGREGPPGTAPLAAGDVLVLVPRRGRFVRALIRALKSADVPVASLVRSGLVDQIAVHDLLSLCEALLLPQDDLVVGCVLTSPLGGLDDDALTELAVGRGRASLWDRLRERHGERADWAAAWSLLQALSERVDYASPYALLAEALGRLGGRARLLARLGPEAGEPVDELLAAAQRFEDTEPPSLQGFVHWLRNSEETIRREPEAAGDAVRVMTVHGAKGLQASLVVLPDTTSEPPKREPLLWTEEAPDAPGLPLWVPRKELSGAAARRLAERTQQSRREERNRLLYVALTRAADRLVVCGWQSSRGMPQGAWYELCRRGFERLGASAEPCDLGWVGERLVLEGAMPAHAAAGVARRTVAPVALPAWLGRAPLWTSSAPPPEPALPVPLAPSRPEGILFGPQPAARSPLAGRRPGGSSRLRGSIVHALLQHLPQLSEPQRGRAALDYAAQPGFGLPPGAAERLADEVLAVMRDGRLAGLFGPAGRAEQPITGLVGAAVITGQIDRLLIEPARIVLCDFKTGREPPSNARQAPVAYLRQMSAYRALLRLLPPARPVECLLVWTEGPLVMSLPDALLDQHAPPAAQA